MDDKKQHIQLLYGKWIDKTASDQEVDELFLLLEREDIKNTLDSPFKSLWQQEEVADGIVHERHRAILVSIMDQFPAERSSIHSVNRIHFLRTSWFRYAAAIILLIGITIVIVKSSNWQSRQQTLVSNNKLLQTDIAPGTNRAVLNVDNKQIDLASDKTGITVADNTVTYTDGQRLSNAGNILTLTTPRGGQYQIVLPDGSKVWLNAASSIKFPAAFTGLKRNVEVTGEVYMEIAMNSKQPFVVNTRGSEVQVLGTSFNINSYADEEAIKTTLVEGSVKVGQVILKPGQQAVQALNTTAAVVNSQQPNTAGLSAETSIKIINNTDLNQILAWKNGIFQFNHTNLVEIMRQLSRWYDIEVLYESGVPDIQLDGEMKQDLKLPQVLNFLGKFGVKFRMEGRRLIILK